MEEKEYSPERVPHYWAGTHSNLGFFLRTLGKQEGGKVGAAYLNEAVAVHRAALSVFEASDVSSYAEDARRNLALSEAALERARKDGLK
jgi:hypothetical protein